MKAKTMFQHFTQIGSLALGMVQCVLARIISVYYSVGKAYF